MTYQRRGEIAAHVGSFPSAMPAVQNALHVDVLVSFAPDASWRFYDFVSVKEEREAMFGRPVDLIEKRRVERSENYIRRRHILNRMGPIYMA
jgi:predicted nucleotidyltransferase